METVIVSGCKGRDELCVAVCEGGQGVGVGGEQAF